MPGPVPGLPARWGLAGAGAKLCRPSLLGGCTRVLFAKIARTIGDLGALCVRTAILVLGRRAVSPTLPKSPAHLRLTSEGKHPAGAARSAGQWPLRGPRCGRTQGGAAQAPQLAGDYGPPPCLDSPVYGGYAPRHYNSPPPPEETSWGWPGVALSTWVAPGASPIRGCPPCCGSFLPPASPPRPVCDPRDISRSPTQEALPAFQSRPAPKIVKRTTPHTPATPEIIRHAAGPCTS